MAVVYASYCACFDVELKCTVFVGNAEQSGRRVAQFSICTQRLTIQRGRCAIAAVRRAVCFPSVRRLERLC